MFGFRKKTQDPTLSRKEKFKKEAKSSFWIILAVLIFRSVLFEPFKIPSGSMIPTLLIGDFILVNKFAYGFKVPFSDWFSDPIYFSTPEKPERGDVIVFKYPRDESFNYIKRVVGLPGDSIEVVDKVVYVNNEPLQLEEFGAEEIQQDMDDKYKNYNFKYFKTKTGDHKHVTQVHEDNVFSANYPKIEVPKGHYFVMGDNRDFSADSRSWGFVPFQNIKGEAILIWFSFSFPWPWEQTDITTKFRLHRIGTQIDDAPGLN